MSTQFALEESGKLREQTEEELAALDKLAQAPLFYSSFFCAGNSIFRAAFKACSS